MFRTLVLVAGLVAAPVASHASELLATGPIYGGSTQAVGVCYLYNSGSSSVTLSSAAIDDQNGGNVTATSTCGATLAGGASCALSATFSSLEAHFCTVTASAVKALRGFLDIRNAATPVAILTTQTLH